MRSYHWPERLPEILVLLLGLLLSLSVAWAAQAWEVEQRAERIRANLAVCAQGIGQQLQSLVAAAQALAQFYRHSDLVQPQELALFVRPFMERDPAIQALAWAPLVRATDRGSFEAQGRAQGAAGFAIREQIGADLGPAAARPDYFPVSRIVPDTGNARALGFDLGSEPRRRAALEQARDTGQATATAPLTLVQEAAHQRSILVLVPVGAAMDASVQERRQQLRGFAVGAMRLGATMEQVIAALPPLGLDLVLLDANVPGEAGLLHVHSSRTRGPAMALDAPALIHRTDGQAIPLAVAGRTLVLHAIPAPGAYPTGGWSWALAGFGLVTSLALFSLLRYRRAAVARLREREERLRLALDAAQMGIYDWDLVTNRISLSPQQEQLWGFVPGEFDGTYDTFVSRVHPDDRPALAAQIAYCIAERRRYSYEMRVVWPDWSVHWVIGLGEFVFDAAGRAVRMTGGTMEITERKRAEADLLAGKAQLEAALASMTDAVFISDTEGSLTHINEAFATFHRFRDKDACARTFAEYPALMDVFMADGTVAAVAQRPIPRALRGETARDVEYHLQRKDTRETWIGSYSFAPIRDPDGTIIGAVVTCRDLTERKQADLQLRRYQQIVETSQAMFVFVDSDLCYQVANPAYAALYQTTPQALHGRLIRVVVGAQAYERIGPELLAALAGERRHFSFQRTFPDGRHRYLEADYSPFWVAGVVEGVVASLHDVTAAQEARAALQAQQTRLEEALREAQMARIDALTGIANRAGFEDRLQQAFAQARRHRRRFGLIFLDLDGFKAINDTRGHLVGDQVLRDVAASLTENCRPEDLAGRYGGDEFALVLSEVGDCVAAVAVAERVRDAVAALNWDGSGVSASVGVALYPDHADDLLELIRLADLAMYAAKAAGKNRVILAASLPPPSSVGAASGRDEVV